MMQIQIFGGTFTCDKDDETIKCYTYLTDYTFVAKIDNIYFEFCLDCNTGSFTLEFGNIKIS